MNKEERIHKYTEFMKGKGIRVRDLDKLGFFDAPASINHHGNYEGGLFDHSLATAEELVNMTERLGLKWKHPDSPYVVGMFHDLCKCDAYIKTEEGYTYNPDILIPGHGDKSVMICQRYLSLTDEEIICIRWHMGAFEENVRMWNYYGKAIKKYPNALYTHTADMAASKIRGI